MVGWSRTIYIRENNITHIKKQIIRSLRQHFNDKGNKQKILIAVKLLLNVCDIASSYVNSRVPSNYDEKKRTKD